MRNSSAFFLSTLILSSLCAGICPITVVNTQEPHNGCHDETEKKTEAEHCPLCEQSIDLGLQLTTSVQDTPLVAAILPAEDVVIFYEQIITDTKQFAIRAGPPPDLLVGSVVSLT